MTGASGPFWSPPPAPRPSPARRWWLVPVVAVAAVVLVAAVLWLYVLPTVAGRYALWVPLGGFFLVFIVLWLSFAIVRMAWWSQRRQQFQEYRAARQGMRPGPRDPSVWIVRQRYARGEISRDEYERLLHDLQPGDRLP